MANYKKFLYISGKTEGQKLADIKAAGYLNEGGKYFKTIVFAAETNELYNRGQQYGLSKADAQRITDLETALAALQTAQLAVATGDKVLTITDVEGGTKTIGATLSIDYGKKAEGDTKYIFLKGKNGDVISEIDATDFIKDKVVTDAELFETAEEGVSVEVPYIKLEFSESVDPIRFSVKSLVDIYNAANINLTSGFSVPESYTEGNIKSGASMDAAVAEIVAGIRDAKNNGGITKIGEYKGAVTLKGDNTDNGTINLSIDASGVISATIVGLGSAAYTDATAYATAAQGGKADSAVQGVSAEGDDFLSLEFANKDAGNNQKLTGSIATANPANADAEDFEEGLTKASEVSAFVKEQVSGKNVDAEGDELVGASAANNKVSVSATQDLKDAVANANSALQSIEDGEDSNFISVSVSAKNNGTTQTVTASATLCEIANAAKGEGDTADVNGLVTALDVKGYIDDLEWEEL